MQVYWLESLDHAEDWFVAADSNESATQFFAEQMGYDVFRDEVCATPVCEVSEQLVINHHTFLSSDDIKACGGQFIDFHDEDLLEHIPEKFLRMVAGETRIVRFGNKVYMEGNIMRLALQMQGKLTQS